MCELSTLTFPQISRVFLRDRISRLVTNVKETRRIGNSVCLEGRITEAKSSKVKFSGKQARIGEEPLVLFDFVERIIISNFRNITRDAKRSRSARRFAPKKSVLLVNKGFTKTCHIRLTLLSWNYEYDSKPSNEPLCGLQLYG